jgi:hypothetical protein
MRAALLFLAIPAMALAEVAPKVPSGQPVRLMEVLKQAADTGGAAVRFRFLAPKLKRGGQNQKDLLALCKSVALPEVKKSYKPPFPRIVLSLSSKPVKFGETAPGVAQVFDAFTVVDGQCEEAPPW